MQLRHEEVKDILAQAGPKGKEIARAIAGRRSFEIHVHITGPVIVGSEVAQLLAPLLLRIPDKAGNKPASD